jgi:endogenous inhibitor of DNA gyrase (YacG/DUF329 family)
MACPICGRAAVAAWRPFCSRRCADVDLGRWLTGAYAVPVVDAPDGEAPDGEAPDGEAPDGDAPDGDAGAEAARPGDVPDADGRTH